MFEGWISQRGVSASRVSCGRAPAAMISATSAGSSSPGSPQYDGDDATPRGSSPSARRPPSTDNAPRDQRSGCLPLTRSWATLSAKGHPSSLAAPCLGDSSWRATSATSAPFAERAVSLSELADDLLQRVPSRAVVMILLSAHHRGQRALIRVDRSQGSSHVGVAYASPPLTS